MAKRKANLQALGTTDIELPRLEARKMPNPVIPTGDVRHVAAVREGRQSAEIYCRNPKRREELGLPPLPDPDSLFVEELRA